MLCILKIISGVTFLLIIALSFIGHVYQDEILLKLGGDIELAKKYSIGLFFVLFGMLCMSLLPLATVWISSILLKNVGDKSHPLVTPFYKFHQLFVGENGDKTILLMIGIIFVALLVMGFEIYKTLAFNDVGIK